jgi:hypothetical protein
MPNFMYSVVLWFLPYLGPDVSRAQDRANREDWFDALVRSMSNPAAEWSVSRDPFRMLELAGEKLSERKRRLFAVACLRRVWDRLTSDDTRHAVEVAERVAEGLVGDEEVIRVAEAAMEAYYLQAGPPRYWNALPDRAATLALLGPEDLKDAVLCSVRFVEPNADGVLPPSPADRAAQADLLREIAGNPFTPSVIDPSWLAWSGGSVRKLAQVIYDERRWEDLPILADALEEAGCTDAQILSHCRGGGEHYRGCWVLDLVLGKW